MDKMNFIMDEFDTLGESVYAKKIIDHVDKQKEKELKLIEDPFDLDLEEVYKNKWKKL